MHMSKAHRDRVAAVAARRLGVPVNVLGWAQDAHGCRVAVVQVAAHKADHARALGFKVAAGATFGDRVNAGNCDNS